MTSWFHDQTCPHLHRHTHQGCNVTSLTFTGQQTGLWIQRVWQLLRHTMNAILGKWPDALLRRPFHPSTCKAMTHQIWKKCMFWLFGTMFNKNLGKTISISTFSWPAVSTKTRWASECKPSILHVAVGFDWILRTQSLLTLRNRQIRLSLFA